MSTIYRASRAPTLSPPRVVRLAAGCAFLLLSACASEPAREPDEPVDRLIAQDAAAAAAAQPLENTYPDLRNVPARPTLGYTVAQRRQIQEGLVADMEYAKRTSELVRTTDGAAPPPPPKSPPVIPGEEPPANRTATTPKPPGKVVLIERRDTSGDLSNFLDDVVGLEAEVDSAQGVVRVPPGSGRNPTPGPPLTDSMSGSGQTTTIPAAPLADTEPGFFSGLAGVFGGSTDETVTVDPETPPASEPGDAPLAIGRQWSLPLASGGAVPADDVLAPVLTALSMPGALDQRRVAVSSREVDPARRVVDKMVERGVPDELVSAEEDAQAPADTVVVSVLPTSG